MSELFNWFKNKLLETYDEGYKIGYGEGFKKGKEKGEEKGYMKGISESKIGGIHINTYGITHFKDGSFTHATTKEYE